MGNAKSSDVCWKKQLFKNSLRENKAKKFDIFLLEITSRGGGGGRGVNGPQWEGITHARLSKMN